MSSRKPVPLAQRDPLRILFVITSMPVGGAETLLVNLIRQLDRSRFEPLLCCLKELGELGETLTGEIPCFSQQIHHKFDFPVLGRLKSLIRRERVDAVITVGAGDKMFWGRLAAWQAAVPVVASALHSTGWPDVIGRANRLLTRITDAFIAVAKEHGKYLEDVERFPGDKVRVIPNGVDTVRFVRCAEARRQIRMELGIPAQAPTCGIIAALRPEKNHRLFLQAAQQIAAAQPECQFLIVGDGAERAGLEAFADTMGVTDRTHFLGTRSDIANVLSSLDVFMLTSDMEANPVSILEAMACSLPVVATDVGSVSESVVQGTTGFLARPGDATEITRGVLQVLADREAAAQMGREARHRVEQSWSLASMVAGYERLIREIYERKAMG